jgi:hypothetical protein
MNKVLNLILLMLVSLTSSIMRMIDGPRRRQQDVLNHPGISCKMVFLLIAHVLVQSTNRIRSNHVQVDLASKKLLIQCNVLWETLANGRQWSSAKRDGMGIIASLRMLSSPCLIIVGRLNPSPYSMRQISGSSLVTSNISDLSCQARPTFQGYGAMRRLPCSALCMGWKRA